MNDSSGNPNQGSTKSWLRRLPWLELIVTGLIGLLLQIVLEDEISIGVTWGEVLAGVTWILGGLITLNKLVLETRFQSTLERELAPVHKLSEVVDLSTRCEIPAIQDVLQSYLRVVEPEFLQLRDGIVQEARDRLVRLAERRSSDDLAPAEYYEWLLPMFEKTGKGSIVRATSLMLTSEWDDSPPEKEFFKLMVTAAERGALIERVFITDRTTMTAALENPVVTAQVEDEMPTLLRGYFVDRDRLRLADPRLDRDVVDGFIAFDDRVALVDIASSDGRARGRVTVHPSEVAGLVRQHKLLMRHAVPLSMGLMRGDGSTASAKA